MVLLDNVGLSLYLSTLEGPMINGSQDRLQKRRQTSGNHGTWEGQKQLTKSLTNCGLWGRIKDKGHG